MIDAIEIGDMHIAYELYIETFPRKQQTHLVNDNNDSGFLKRGGLTFIWPMILKFTQFNHLRSSETFP